MASPKTTSRAGPGLAYRPSNPPGLGYDSDGDDDRRRLRGRLNFTAIFRLAVAGLAFSDIIVWISLSLISIQYSFVIIVFVELFVVIGWNLSLVIPPSFITRVLPEFLCRIGGWTCALIGEDGHERLLRKFKTKPQKQRKLVLRAVGDVMLGLSIMLIMGELGQEARATPVSLGAMLTSSC
jgi:hypothetical protein